MKEILGTPFYVSPDILLKEYTLACDYWSIGVIAYILLAGYPPFSGSTEKEIYSKILTCNYQFNIEDWKGISKESQNFIEKLLHPIASKRMTPS